MLNVLTEVTEKVPFLEQANEFVGKHLFATVIVLAVVSITALVLVAKKKNKYKRY